MRFSDRDSIGVQLELDVIKKKKFEFIQNSTNNV